MKDKYTKVGIISLATIVFGVIAYLGIQAIQRGVMENIDEKSRIEQLLKELDETQVADISDQFTDFGSDIDNPIDEEVPTTTKNVQYSTSDITKSVSDIDSLLGSSTSANTSEIDGGFGSIDISGL